MLYAVKHRKAVKGIYKNNEDALTAAIFERLMYLPKELFQHIFQEALFDKSVKIDLNQMESISYWPNWNPEETYNKNYVEPDVFIQTAKQNIIVEAKRYDSKQQNVNQWKNEIQAYYNEFGKKEKPLVFIALGGLYTTDTEKVTISDTSQDIYKCTWSRILNVVQHIVHEMEIARDYTHSNVAINQILKDIILCFEIFGFSTSLWLERFIKAPNIKQQSINTLATSWTN
jgi:hypothetical protein